MKFSAAKISAIRNEIQSQEEMKIQRDLRKIKQGMRFLTILFTVGTIGASAYGQDVEVEAAAVEAAAPAPAPVEPEPASVLSETVVQSSPSPATASRPRETPVYRNVQPQVLVAPQATVEVVDTLEPQVPVANVVDLPGSGYFVTASEIREQNYVNPNRVLARVPGVYTREEGGSGIFPNISIRGADGTRSEKVTVMEDGVLTAPATYSAPSAYYSPNIARMAGVEILKGSSQVRFGPHTTGGVINYLSTPIPEHEQFYMRGTIGTDTTRQFHTHYGDTLEGAYGKFGYLAELHYKDSDGFRDIDGGLTVPGNGDTGYKNTDPMIKLSWEPNSIRDQRFEFKYGASKLDADETYLGLTEADARANPYRRYAGSFADNIDAEHHRTYLKHQIEINENLSVETMGYYNNFYRDWFKIRQVNGNSLHNVLADPNGNAADFATLTGQAGGNLGYRHNAREYEAYGFQVEASYLVETEMADHNFTIGGRRHKDSIRRYQENTNIITAIGAAPVFLDQGPGTGGNRYQETYATSVWIQDAVDFGRLTLTPGVRYEHLDQRYIDYQNDATNTPTASGRGSTGIATPGIGVHYEIDEHDSVYGGVYRGVSAPGPRSHIASEVDWEKSIGYEVGFRHTSGNFNAELGGFYTDFEQLIGQSAGLGQNAGGALSNAGEAEVYGVEFLATYDPFQDRRVRMPLFVSTTWTSATLTGDQLKAGGGEDIYGDGDGGPGILNAELPYIPEWKLAMGIGLETDNWGVDLNATYLSETFGTALNSSVPVTSSRQGYIDGGFIVDLSTYYAITPRINMIGGIHNLFDNEMVTSRVPEGPRNGAPRQGFVGFEILWEPSVEE